MQFLMLVCDEPPGSATPVSEADLAAAPDTEQWWRRTNDAGRYVLGDRLRPAGDAVSVRVRDGKRVRDNGTVIEGGGSIVGFDVIDCADIDEAVEVVSSHTMAYAGVIELRALWPLGG